MAEKLTDPKKRMAAAGRVKRWTSRLQRWQIVTAIVTVLLGGIAPYSFVYYSKTATRQDREAMLKLAVDGSQLATLISTFLDERVQDLDIVAHVGSGAPEVRAAEVQRQASKRFLDPARSGAISAYGIRADCDGPHGRPAVDTDGPCNLLHYARVSTWYRVDPKKDEWHRVEADASATAKAPPWVERAANNPGTTWISRLEGRWLARSEAKLEGVLAYTPRPLYEGVFHLARGAKVDQGLLVLVLDLDQAHIAEFVKRYSDKAGLDAFQWRSTYDRASYAYIVDDRTWIIAHPRPWHIVGWEEEGGARRTRKGITGKQQIGFGPLNFIEYLKVHPPDDSERSDDMSNYYSAVVEAVQEKRPHYGSGGNLAEHKRLIWAQPIALTNRFKWAPAVPGEDEPASEAQPIFGAVVVGNDLGTLSTALRYSDAYWGGGALLVLLLVLTVLRWTAQLAELDMLAGTIAPTTATSRRGLGSLVHSFVEAPVARLRDAIRQAASARRDARARAFQKDVISQLVGPLVVLDLALRGLRGRAGEPVPPDKELLEEIDLSIRQLKMLVHESGYAKLDSDDVNLCDLLKNVVERSWPGRVELVTPETEVRYPIPPRVVEDSVTQLVINALRAVEVGKGKFVRPAGWNADVRIELSGTDQGPIIDVLDRGIGIPSHIDPFDWGSSSWGPASESLPGMGLPCTRLRLAMFGAEIAVLPNDEQHRGAGFRIRLAPGGLPP